MSNVYFKPTPVKPGKSRFRKIFLVTLLSCVGLFLIFKLNLVGKVVDFVDSEKDASENFSLALNTADDSPRVELENKEVIQATDSDELEVQSPFQDYSTHVNSWVFGSLLQQASDSIDLEEENGMDNVLASLNQDQVSFGDLPIRHTYENQQNSDNRSTTTSSEAQNRYHERLASSSTQRQNPLSPQTTIPTENHNGQSRNADHVLAHNTTNAERPTDSIHQLESLLPTTRSETTDASRQIISSQSAPKPVIEQEDDSPVASTHNPNEPKPATAEGNTSTEGLTSHTEMQPTNLPESQLSSIPSNLARSIDSRIPADLVRRISLQREPTRTAQASTPRTTGDSRTIQMERPPTTHEGTQESGTANTSNSDGNEIREPERRSDAILEKIREEQQRIRENSRQTDDSTNTGEKSNNEKKDDRD
jgi:hypothetical protein